MFSLTSEDSEDPDIWSSYWVNYALACPLYGHTSLQDAHLTKDLLTNSDSYDWSWKWKKKNRLYKSIPKLYHYISEFNSYKVTMKSKLKMKPVPKGSEICIREIKTKRNPISCLRQKKMLVLMYILYSVNVVWNTLPYFTFLMYPWSSSGIWPSSVWRALCSWSNKFNVFKWKYVIKLTRKKISNIF